MLSGRWSLFHSAPPSPALRDTSSPVTLQVGVGVPLPGGRVTQPRPAWCRFGGPVWDCTPQV